MTKVWILYSGHYSDRYVVGVFSTSGTANVASGFVAESDVQEFETDALVPAMERRMRGEKLYEVEIDLATGFIPAYGPPREPENLRDADEKIEGTYYRAHLWARDKAHALKILTERRQAILREWAARGQQPEEEPSKPAPSVESEGLK